MNLEFKSIWILIFVIPFITCQVDEQRRKRHPHEFYQIGAETHAHDIHHPVDDHSHHTHRVVRLHSVPPVGTSEYVKYFARLTSGQHDRDHHIHGLHDDRTISYKAVPSGGDTVVTRVRYVDDHNHDHVHADPHSSHRNFVTAGVKRYYAVRSPASHEPHAPIVGHYHSTYQDRNLGGKIYLGNRPLYF